MHIPDWSSPTPSPTPANVTFALVDSPPESSRRQYANEILVDTPPESSRRQYANEILVDSPPDSSRLHYANKILVANNSSPSSFRPQVPVAALSLFDVGFLIFFIPIMDLVQRKMDKKGTSVRWS